MDGCTVLVTIKKIKGLVASLGDQALDIVLLRSGGRI